VWVNHILARESNESHGIPSEIDKMEMEEDRLPELFKKVVAKHYKPDLLSSYKWTGKPIDRWNTLSYYGLSKKVQSFS
jgi:hypothetical protein